MNHLTTHVLDTVTGASAAGLCVSLHQLTPAPRFLSGLTLDASGRGAFENELTPGIYELRFEVGDYHQKVGLATSDPSFLGLVPVRFSVGVGGGHYHVPLILSLFGYSVYRGSYASS